MNFFSLCSKFFIFCTVSITIGFCIKTYCLQDLVFSGPWGKLNIHHWGLKPSWSQPWGLEFYRVSYRPPLESKTSSFQFLSPFWQNFLFQRKIYIHYFDYQDISAQGLTFIFEPRGVDYQIQSLNKKNLSLSGHYLQGRLAFLNDGLYCALDRGSVQIKDDRRYDLKAEASFFSKNNSEFHLLLTDQQRWHTLNFKDNLLSYQDSENFTQDYHVQHQDENIILEPLSSQQAHRVGLYDFFLKDCVYHSNAGLIRCQSWMESEVFDQKASMSMVYDINHDSLNIGVHATLANDTSCESDIQIEALSSPSKTINGSVFYGAQKTPYKFSYNQSPNGTVVVKTPYHSFEGSYQDGQLVLRSASEEALNLHLTGLKRWDWSYQSLAYHSLGTVDLRHSLLSFHDDSIKEQSLDVVWDWKEEKFFIKLSDEKSVHDIYLSTKENTYSATLHGPAMSGTFHQKNTGHWNLKRCDFAEAKSLYQKTLPWVEKVKELKNHFYNFEDRTDWVFEIDRLSHPYGMSYAIAGHYRDSLKDQKTELEWTAEGLSFFAQKHQSAWEGLVVIQSLGSHHRFIDGGPLYLNFYQSNQNTFEWRLYGQDVFFPQITNEHFIGFNILSGEIFKEQQWRSVLCQGVAFDHLTLKGQVKDQFIIFEQGELKMGPLRLYPQGGYDITSDKWNLLLAVRPQVSAALSSLIGLFQPWTMSLTLAGMYSVGEHLNAWNEELYTLKGSSLDWTIERFVPPTVNLLDQD